MTSTHRKQAFELEHQHLELNLDFKRRTLRGCAQLTLSLPKRLEHILLHCRQISILGVRIGDVPRHYTCANFLQQMVPDPTRHVCDGHSFRTLWKTAQEASDEYDLVINAPEPISDQWPQHLTVAIDYELIEPQGGLIFVLPQERTHPNRREHCYTVSELGAARTWMPCVDFPVARCTWTIALTVPDTMQAVAVGELEQREILDQQNRIRYVYRLGTPSSAQHVLFAVGPFESVHDSPSLQLQMLQQQQQEKSQTSASGTQPSDPKKGPASTNIASAPWRSGVLTTSFCLPGRTPLLSHTCKDTVSRALEHLEQYLKLRFPYQSMKIVFVEAPFDKMLVGAGLLLISTHVLHSARIIDQHVKTKKLLWTGMARCWVISQVVLRSWYDTWIETGITAYLASIVYRHTYGANMHKEAIWKIMLSLMDAQVQGLQEEARLPSGSPATVAPRGRVALYDTNFLTPHELYMKPHLQKSFLAFHLMERRLGQEGLRKVISNILLPPSGPLSAFQPLKTESFLKICRKTTGEDLQHFADTWIYTDICPVISCGFTFNKKKSTLLVAMKQESAKGAYVADLIRIRVFQPENKVFESRQLVPPLSDDNKSTCHVFEIPLTSDNMRAPTTRRQEDSNLAVAPCSWIRVDPEIDWMRKLQLRQPLFMWINQLLQDRDVFAQLEAFDGICSVRLDQIRTVSESDPNLNVVNILKESMLRRDYYIAVRIQAAKALSYLASRGLPGASAGLIDVYKRKYWISAQAQWRPNDFHALPEYFLKKALVNAIASIVDKDTGLTPKENVDFVIDVLRNNDNSRNKYEDNYFLASVLESLGGLSLTSLSFSQSGTSILDPENTPLTYGGVVAELERYLNRDKSSPSFHNIISIACLKALSNMMLSGKTPAETEVFKRYLRAGNFEHLRREAASCLLKLACSAPPSTEQHDGILSAEARLDAVSSVFDSVILSKSDCGWLRAEAARMSVLYLKDLPKHLQPVIFSYPLRRSVWIALNGPLTAFDPRIRVHLSIVHVLMSYFWKDQAKSGWTLMNRRPAIPPLPTRPVPKASEIPKELPDQTAKARHEKQIPRSQRSSRTVRTRQNDDGSDGDMDILPPAAESVPPTPAARPSLKVGIKLSALASSQTSLAPTSPVVTQSPKSPSWSPRESSPRPLSPAHVSPLSPLPLSHVQPTAPMSPVVAPVDSTAPTPTAAHQPPAPTAKVVLNSGTGKLTFKFTAKPSVSQSEANPFPHIKRVRMAMAGLIWLSETDVQPASSLQAMQPQPEAGPKPIKPRRKPAPAGFADDGDFVVAEDEDYDDEFVPSAAQAPRRSKASGKGSSSTKRKSGRSRRKRVHDDFDDDYGDDADSDEVVESLEEEPDADDDFTGQDEEGNWN